MHKFQNLLDRSFNNGLTWTKSQKAYVLVLKNVTFYIELYIWNTKVILKFLLGESSCVQRTLFESNHIPLQFHFFFDGRASAALKPSLMKQLNTRGGTYCLNPKLQYASRERPAIIAEVSTKIMYSNKRQLAGIASLAIPTALQYRWHTRKIMLKQSHNLPISSAFSLCSHSELPVALYFIIPLGGCDHLTKAHCLTRAD